MIRTDRSGCPPRSTRPTWVSAHTAIRWSPALTGSSELIMYSTRLLLYVSAGCTPNATSPSTRSPMWAKCGVRSPDTRSCLEMAYSCAPLNTGRLIENSSVVTYRLCASIPIRGWSPKQGQPLPPRSDVPMRTWGQGVVGSPDVLTAMSSRPRLTGSFKDRLVAHQGCVEGTYRQRG